ncbi:MAG TPA: hypothetical protein VHT73_06230 [Thermodesulfobacteriota bacterium]|nr:hypothetical protein [Thermodesulfobacteriota bacterium]
MSKILLVPIIVENDYSNPDVIWGWNRRVATCPICGKGNVEQHRAESVFCVHYAGSTADVMNFVER